MFARPVALGNERILEDKRYLFGTEPFGIEHPEEETGPIPVRDAIRRIGSEEVEDQFLILATSTLDPEKATSLYRRYWEIQTMIATLKSRGFNLEDTHVTGLDRV